MTIYELLALDDFDKAVDILTTDTIEGRDVEAYYNEYIGKRDRRDTSVDKREDKRIDVFSETETEIDEDGNEVPKKIGHDIVKVAKFHTNYPKKIVRIAAAFLFGGEMSISFNENNDATQFWKELYEDGLKMKSVLNKFARTVMSETKSALIFYPRPSERDGEEILDIKVKVLNHKNGEFYPHFDEYGDMDAFVRKYKSLHSDGEKRDFLWVQTATKELTYVSIDGSWIKTVDQDNKAGKITVVYAEQEFPEWEDVVSAIDYYENRVSRLIDTNDYFGDPILKQFGNSALPSKRTVGKQITYPMTTDEEGNIIHGDAEYLVWDQSINSIKEELQVLRSEILSGTSTPDLSFENMKSIANISGVTMRLMFLDAFIKSAEKMEIFGPVVKRTISVVMALVTNVTNISYKSQLRNAKPRITFGTILPDNLKEIIETLTSANGGKRVNSTETLVSISPFTQDVQEEISRMKKEDEVESDMFKLEGVTF